VKRLIRINGETVELPDSDADIIETEPGVYSILIGGRSFEARVVSNEISIEGQRFVFEIDDSRQWKRSTRGASAQSGGSVVAAMPGKIVRVLVSVGDQVTAGQGILVVEAMKMQNELKAPREGRVTAIEVRENDSVNAGALLVTIG
jgi:biotin carboxyl carrier protein